MYLWKAIIEPAELVFAYSSKTTGANSFGASFPNTYFEIKTFIFSLAWWRYMPLRSLADKLFSSKWDLIKLETSGTTSLNTFRPFWWNNLSDWPTPSGDELFKKP